MRIWLMYHNFIKVRVDFQVRQLSRLALCVEERLIFLCL